MINYGPDSERHSSTSTRKTSSESTSFLCSRILLTFLKDTKADNILVEMSGVCKISDFRISKRTEGLQGGAFTAIQGTVF